MLSAKMNISWWNFTLNQIAKISKTKMAVVQEPFWNFGNSSCHNCLYLQGNFSYYLKPWNFHSSCGTMHSIVFTKPKISACSKQKLVLFLSENDNSCLVVKNPEAQNCILKNVLDIAIWIFPKFRFKWFWNLQKWFITNKNSKIFLGHFHILAGKVW